MVCDYIDLPHDIMLSVCWVCPAHSVAFRIMILGCSTMYNGVWSLPDTHQLGMQLNTVHTHWKHHGSLQIYVILTNYHVALVCTCISHIFWTGAFVHRYKNHILTMNHDTVTSIWVHRTKSFDIWIFFFYHSTCCALTVARCTRYGNTKLSGKKLALGVFQLDYLVFITRWSSSADVFKCHVTKHSPRSIPTSFIWMRWDKAAGSKFSPACGQIKRVWCIRCLDAQFFLEYALGWRVELDELSYFADVEVISLHIMSMCVLTWVLVSNSFPLLLVLGCNTILFTITPCLCDPGRKPICQINSRTDAPVCINQRCFSRIEHLGVDTTLHVIRSVLSRIPAHPITFRLQHPNHSWAQGVASCVDDSSRTRAPPLYKLEWCLLGKQRNGFSDCFITGL